MVRAGAVGKRRWPLAVVVGVVVVAAFATVVWLATDRADDLLTVLSGGEGTTASSDSNAFGNSARNLSNDERRRFEIGDSFFTENWVIAPASTGSRDGLGPLLNASSCSSCHLRDGRGSPEPGELGLLIRIGVAEGETATPDPVYGDQIQDRGIGGVEAEAIVVTTYVDVVGSYDDGTPYLLRKPIHDLDDLAYGPISTEVQTSPRLAPAVIGSGLLQAIAEEDILALADPEDADGDGVSGRPNYVLDVETGGRALGRFGWKANVPTVSQQVAGAFLGDIGITSSLLPAQNCTIPQTACLAAPTGGEPEIDDELFDTVVFYTMTLAVPARRDLEDPAVASGARLFRQVGCDSCHVPHHRTGPSEVAALAAQDIYPFTDLLLHDMGPDLADGRPDGQASGSEWRTPPLWGLGLNDVVNGHDYYLHDGRARSVEEAILWHGGEAASAADGFRSLTAEQRGRLLAFLESL